MKNNNEAVKDQTPKTQPQAPKAKTSKVKKVTKEAPADADAEAPKAPVSQPAAAAVKAVQTEQVPKAPKAKAAKVEDDAETGDRLPGNLEELKATKGGLVCFLFFSGKDKEEITKELKTAFKLTDVHAVKIVRRITGRARLFQRVSELMAAK